MSNRPKNAAGVVDPRPRLLWVSHIVPYPPKSGVHLRAYQLITAASQTNAIDLVAFVQSQWLKTFFDDPEEGLKVCKVELEKLCASVTFVEITSHAGRFGKLRTVIRSLLPGPCYSVRWLSSLAAVKTIQRLYGQREPDIIHIDTIGLAPYRRLYPAVPAALGHHNIESHMMLRRSENERNLLKKFYFLQEGLRLRRFERTAAKAFAIHLTCSDLDSKRLLDIDPTIHASAVPNGVDTDYFQPLSVDVDPLLAIFVGSLNWYPNTQAAMSLLKDIWPLVLDRLPNARLSIVGTGANEAMRQVAAVTPSVKMHGFVDDVRPIMSSAAVYVCPITDGGGTKLKLLDAFAMQKCVVAHPIACEGLSIHPGASVLLAETPQQFAEAVEKLMNDSELRKTIGSEARRLVLQTYSTKLLAPRVQGIFSMLARSNEN